MAGELNHEQARAYYDRLGAGQDLSRFFEDPATLDLAARAALDEADSVVEFGHGTGRFAELLLDCHLPADASYLGFDQSDTMHGLASERLARFAPRARVVLTDGSPKLAAPDASFARFVSCYVFDLLSEADMRAVLAEAQRLLRPGGLLCLANLSPGETLLTRLFERGWLGLYSLSPRLVGGCRPIEPEALLAEDAWHGVYQRRLSSFGVPSQVLIARRL